MSTTSGPDRLADALDAYLARPRAGEAPSQEWNARRRELAELLDPMLQREDGPAPPRRDTRADEEIASQVGPYRLLREIGRGGMGVVYEAVHEADGSPAAVKLLPASRAGSAQAVERFRREARAVERLDHPGIVRVREDGVDGRSRPGMHWLAMELVRGRSLRDAFQGVREACSGDPEAVPPSARLGLRVEGAYWREVVELGAQLADALAHAHAQGVIHRDVKPQNVLIDESGRARLVDFGLARDELDATLTRSGDFAGTPHYTSPEQIDGRRDDIDGRSDLFALGVVLFELLAMRRPFPGEDQAAVLDAIRRDPTPSLREFVPSAPRALSIVIARLLEKQPSQRPATAGIVASDLRAILAGTPITTRRIPVRVALLRFLRRHPVATLATAIALAAAIGIPSAVAFHLHRTREAVAAEQVRTEHNFQKARQAIESQLHEVAAIDLDDLPGMQALRLKLYESAFHLYLELLADRPDDVATQRLAARAAAGIAWAKASLGQIAAALPAFDEAIERDARWITTRDPGSHAQTASLFADRALVREQLGDGPGARADRVRAEEEWSAALADRGVPPRLRIEIGTARARGITSEAEITATTDPQRALRCVERSRQLLADLPADEQQVDLVRVRVAAAEASALFVTGRIADASRALSAGEGVMAHLPAHVSRQQQSVRSAVVSLRAVIDAELGAKPEDLAFDHAHALLDARIEADPASFSPRLAKMCLRQREATYWFGHGNRTNADRLSTLALDEAKALIDSEPTQVAPRTYALGVVVLRAAVLQQMAPNESAAIENLLAEGEAAHRAIASMTTEPTLADVSLGSLLGNHARWLIAFAPQRDLPRGRELLRRAERIQRGVLAGQPGLVPAQNALWNHLRVHSAVSFAMSDRDDALAAVAEGVAIARNADDVIALVDTLQRASEIDRAFEVLRECLERGVVLRERLRKEPLLTTLRKDARFNDLVGAGGK
ncbi:MAG: serine/threonine-protein kinase [Planctomycetota bacterium]